MNKKLLLILLFIFVLGIVGCGAPKKEITSITIDIEYLEIEVGEDGASVKKKAKAIEGSTFLEDKRKTRQQSI